MPNFSAERGKCNGGCRAKRASWFNFRNRIGPDGAEKIFASTIELHGEKAKEKEVVVDTTTQEKNITYPTDTKLAAKIVRGGGKLAPRQTAGFCARVSSEKFRSCSARRSADADARMERRGQGRRRVA